MPAYIEVREMRGRERPTCGLGSDCDDRTHRVRVLIGPGILDPVRASVSAMETALDEIQFEIDNDSGGPKAPVLLIKAARELRAAIKGAERMIKAVEGRAL